MPGMTHRQYLDWFICSRNSDCHPPSAQPRQAGICAYEGTRRTHAHEQQVPRLCQRDQPVEEGQAGSHFHRARLPVAGRAPGNERGDHHPAAGQADAVQHPIEQRARRSREWMAGAILVRIRNFADQHQAAAGISMREQGMACGIAERAAVEFLHSRPERLDGARAGCNIFGLLSLVAQKARRRCRLVARDKGPGQGRRSNCLGNLLGRFSPDLPGNPGRGRHETVAGLLVERLVRAPFGLQAQHGQSFRRRKIDQNGLSPSASGGMPQDGTCPDAISRRLSQDSRRATALVACTVMRLKFRHSLLSVGLLSGLFLVGQPWSARAALAGPGTASPAAPHYAAFLIGVVAGGLGDADIASSNLLEVLKNDPGDAGVRSQAFVFSALAGRHEAAELAGQMEGNPLAPLVLGNAAARMGQWSAAEAGYSQIAGSPLNALLRPLLVAWSQQGAGETDRALTTLLSSTQNSPAQGVYVLHAAMIADLAGRTEQAGRLYQQAITLYPGSDLVFVQSFGSFLSRNGKPAEAKALMQSLVRALPLLALAEPGLDAALPTMPVTTPVQGLARSFLTIASLIQQQGSRGQEAESFMLRFALDLQPDLSAARLLLADLQSSTDKPHQALATLRLIGAADPLNPVAALRIGVIGSANGERAQSRSILERLVRQFPTRAEPSQALGDLLQDDGQYEAAINAYDRAIRIMSPLHGEDWPILFSRATAYDRNKQWKAAQTDLQHALQLSPNQPFLLNYLGYSWVERKQDLPDAKLMIQRALDSKPDDGSIRDSLGWALYRQNDVAGAVHELERAAEQIPEDPTVNIHLGFAYWAAGRKIEARDQWRWALILHPDKQDEARIHIALRESLRNGGNPIAAADALPLSRP